MVGNGLVHMDSGIIQMLPHFPDDVGKIKIVCTNCRTSFKKKNVDGAERVVLEPCHNCGKRMLEINK